MQGIHFGPEHDSKLPQHDGSQIIEDLAGNAFHSGTCAALLLTMFCVVGKALRARASTLLPEHLRQEETTQDDDNRSDVAAAEALHGLWGWGSVIILGARAAQTESQQVHP